jgi:hypothetical protein
MALSWSVRGQRKDVKNPAYLMVLLPEAVRFDGSGFFALAPGSPNPKGMSYGLGRMRAVAPLHTVFSKRSGKIEVLPYLAGELTIEWAVVGTSDCGEWKAAHGKAPTVSISPGAPRIVIRDEFADAKPDSVIRALKGPYEVHVFEDSFQVVDTRSRTLALSRQGTEPNFSPSGRFLIVRPPVAESYEIIDLVPKELSGSIPR